MITETKIDLYKYFGVTRPKGALGYINSYIHERFDEYCPNRTRPAMIVFPGGGYYMRSDRECQPIAISYLAQGFNAFTVEYTTYDDAGETAHMPVMLIEAGMAVAYVRENAEKYAIREDKIAVIGFSAGGHLAGSITTMFDSEEIVNALGEKAKLCRPSASVLSYPVITMHEKTHGGTRDVATNKNPDLYDKYSIDKRVTKNTPPCFVWATSQDNAVPVINSVLMAKALAENDVPFDLHIYNKGVHGLALANLETYKKDCPWLLDEVAKDWFMQSIKFLTELDFIQKEN